MRAWLELRTVSDKKSRGTISKLKFQSYMILGTISRSISHSAKTCCWHELRFSMVSPHQSSPLAVAVDHPSWHLKP
jgi:hypothetical protein